MTQAERAMILNFEGKTGLQDAIWSANGYFVKGVTRETIFAKSKRIEHAWPRFYVMAYMRWLDPSRYSYPVIARLLRLKDHTTVMHGVKRAHELFPDAVFVPMPDLFEAGVAA